MHGSALVGGWSVLLTVGLWLTVGSGTTATPPKETRSGVAQGEKVTPNGKDAVVAALDRLRRTGCFHHPDYPWVVRARAVRGNTLFFVDILRRRKDGKGFDGVGKAVQATLGCAEPRRHSTFGKEDPLIVVRGNVVPVRGENFIATSAGGTVLECEERILDFPLPSGLRESGFLPFAPAEERLSREQREQLRDKFPLSQEQQLLVAAFGEHCYDLLHLEVTRSESGRTVLATASPQLRGATGQCLFARLAIARFDEKGQVLYSFQGKDVTVSVDAYMNLLVGDDTQSITLAGRDGVKLVVPGVKSGQ